MFGECAARERSDPADNGWSPSWWILGLFNGQDVAFLAPFLF